MVTLVGVTALGLLEDRVVDRHVPPEQHDVLAIALLGDHVLPVAGKAGDPDRQRGGRERRARVVEQREGVLHGGERRLRGPQVSTLLSSVFLLLISCLAMVAGLVMDGDPQRLQHSRLAYMRHPAVAVAEPASRTLSRPTQIPAMRMDEVRAKAG